MAAVDRLDLHPVEASSANAAAGTVAATLTTTAASPGAIVAAPSAAAAAASMWVAVPVVATDAESEAKTVTAALAARGVKVTTRNGQAVSATVETNEANRQALTAEPVMSV